MKVQILATLKGDYLSRREGKIQLINWLREACCLPFGPIICKTDLNFRNNSYHTILLLKATNFEEKFLKIKFNSKKYKLICQEIVTLG